VCFEVLLVPLLDETADAWNAFDEPFRVEDEHSLVHYGRAHAVLGAQLSGRGDLSSGREFAGRDLLADVSDELTVLGTRHLTLSS
jgi:hypothetical protein